MLVNFGDSSWKFVFDFGIEFKVLEMNVNIIFREVIVDVKNLCIIFKEKEIVEWWG